MPPLTGRIRGKILNLRNWAIQSAVFLLILFAGAAISTSVSDLSWDGMAYHQPAVIALGSGWNPFYSHELKEFNQFFDKSLKGNAVFINHYPKGSWIMAASVYKVTGIIEAGKMFHFLFLASLFLAVKGFMSRFKRIPPGATTLISLFITLNPVAMCQLFSYYNDIQLYCLTALLIVFSLQYIIFRRKEFIPFLMLTFLLLSQVKFTGMVYGVFILFLTWLWRLFRFRELQPRYIGGLAAVLALSFFWVGYQPYGVNLSHYGNPFYPAIGKGSAEATGRVHVIEGQAPASFLVKNRWSKLFVSLFSQSDFDRKISPRLKTPFTVNKSEMTSFYAEDVRYGGFGPFFGGVLILTGVGLALLSRLPSRRRAHLLIAFILIIIPAALNPESWWARLAPQLWLLPFPLIVAGYYWRRRRRFDSILVGFFRMILFFCLGINILLAGYGHLSYKLPVSVRFQQQLTALSRAAGEIVMAASGPFDISLRQRFKEAGVRSQFVRELPGKPFFQLAGIPETKFRRIRKASAGIIE